MLHRKIDFLAGRLHVLHPRAKLAQAKPFAAPLTSYSRASLASIRLPLSRPPHSLTVNHAYRKGWDRSSARNFLASIFYSLRSTPITTGPQSKTRTIMPADSLRAMATRVMNRNAHLLTDLGTLVPYSLVRPALMRIQDPEQLHQLELNSPQLIGETAELWMNFIKRDVPRWQDRRHEPANPKNWYKVYKKLMREVAKKALDAELELKNAMSSIQSVKEQNRVEIASSSRGAALYSSTVAAQPSRRARIMYDYNSGRTGSKGAHKMTVMEKIRKDVKSAKTGNMGRPMHELQKRHNGVVKPPPQFVEDVKRMKALQQAEKNKVLSPPAKGTVTTSTTRIGTTSTGRPSVVHIPGRPFPKPRPQPAAASGVQPYDLTSDREARLRALKAGKPMPPSTTGTLAGIVSSIEKPRSTGTQNSSLTLDFLETDSDDDLFGDNDSDDRLSNRPNEKKRRLDDHMIDEEDDNLSPPRQKRIALEKEDLGSNSESISSPRPRVVPRKIPRPINARNGSPDSAPEAMNRSHSPIMSSPASSPGLMPLKRKRAAPSLFHKR